VENPYSPPPSLVSSVFIDHVRAAFREPEKQVEMALVELFGRYWADLEVPFEADEVEYSVSDKAGNFSEARTWSFRGLTLFRCLVAGRSTRGVGHFIIDGQSCRLVAPGFWPSLASMGQRRAWALKRVDQAADDDSGLLNVETLEQAYDLGLMAHRAGGSPRLLDVRDPRRGTASTGWTVYVGDRKGAETVRVYDKHSEVLAKRGQAAADLIPRNRVRVERERPRWHGTSWRTPRLISRRIAPFWRCGRVVWSRSRSGASCVTRRRRICGRCWRTAATPTAQPLSRLCGRWVVVMRRLWP
jgi:hypothetical protein